MEYFQNKVRPVLLREEDSEILAMWINIRGNPAGNFFEKFYKLEPRSITLYVKNAVRMVFPGKKVPPAEFRRVIATSVCQSRVHDENMNQTDFLSDFALLINTSVAVIFGKKNNF